MFSAIFLVAAFVGGWFVGKNMSKSTIDAVKAEVLNLEAKAKGLATVAQTDVMDAVTFIKAKLF